ncbi:hypothetical protein KKA14_01555 [bacterium]|nr:hypothetical protein [bacterium]
MAEGIQILKSKLLPPKVPEIVKRDRLRQTLSEIKNKKLTLVIAGAGFGKTTLIAETTQRQNLDFIWYRLDKTDRDFITVLSYLVEGFRSYFPEFGEQTSRRMREADISNLGREAILHSFISEIETNVQKDMVIVLDDFHLIQSGTEIKESVEFILERLPPSIHLVIISRTDPEFHLSRLRAGREVLDIDEKDLVFSVLETGKLYAELFNIALLEKDIKTLHHKTEGWISGLILFYHSLRGKNAEKIDQFLSTLKGTTWIISDYLNENIYETQQDTVREFLKKTSILSRISPDFCDRLLKIDTAKTILSQLENNHLFTFPFDEERDWYYFHHFFQDFLLGRLKSDSDESSLKKLHRDAAILWEQYGEPEEALHHYLEAEEFDEASALLKQLGGDFLLKGRLQLVHSFIDRLPEKYLLKEPRIQYIQARMLELLGKRQESISTYKKAITSFKKAGEKKGAETCLFALGTSYYMSGYFPEAEKVLKELLEGNDNNLSNRIYALSGLIFISAHQGDMKAADSYYESANKLISHLENKNALAWLYFNLGFRYCFAGDYKKSLDCGTLAKDVCEKYQLHYMHAFNYHLISWTHYHLCQFSEGLETAKKGMKLVKARGFQDTSYAWLLTDASLNAIGLNQPAQAIEDINAALDIFMDQESIWGQAWAYHILHDAYIVSGKISDAENSLKKGIKLTQNMTMLIQEGMLKKRLAYHMLKKGLWENSRKLLNEAKNCLKHSKLYVCSVHILYARLLWEQNKNEEARRKLLQAMDLSESNQYDHWIVLEKSWIIPLLVECYIQGDKHAYLIKVLNQIEPRAETILNRYFKSLPDSKKPSVDEIIDEFKAVSQKGLRVRCLGSFKLFRGEEEIKLDQWKSKKALTLFKFLIHCRSRGSVSKDTLIDLLWPDVSSRKGSSRLHDALMSLRKTLEPNIKKGSSSIYLRREGSSYRLDLGEGGWVDVESFKEKISQAEKETDPDTIISLIEDAESLYQGDFLKEDPYAEWCGTERRQLKDSYLSLMEKRIQQLEEKQDYLGCIESAKKYIKMDKYAENIYQRLMTFYSLTNQKHMISRAYHQCEEIMQKEFDSPLDQKTKDLYHLLMST